MTSSRTPPRIAVLAPFRVRSYRFQWPADLATSWAFEMETLILGWYVLTESGSVLLLVLFGALQYLGSLVSPMFGVAGDRIGHRNLLCITRAIYVMLAVTLMVLAFAAMLNPVYVLLLAAFAGLIRPSDLMMRNALIGETMPADRLMGAISISRTTTDSARIAGALTGAGLVSALGMGPVYAVVTTLYCISFVLSLRIGDQHTKAPAKAGAGAGPTKVGAGAAPAQADTFVAEPANATSSAVSPQARSWGDLRDGFTYVWSKPELLAGMCFAFLGNLTAYPFFLGLLPYVAKDVYGVGPTGLGALLAAFAIGGLLGSVVLSLNRITMQPGRMMIVFGVLWHAVVLVFGNLTSIEAGMVMLAFAGFTQSLCMTPLSVMLLQHSSPQYRGRVMAVRILAIWGLPLGLLGAGILISRIGFAPTASLYSVAGLLFTLLIAMRWRAHIWQRPS
jgi:predicted MFS family arabinose efflux permease